MPLGADDPGGSHCPGGAGKAGSDPMGADELHERLTGWIETSGRALELRTARTFRGRLFVRYANQSVAYEDPETKQQREGDVVAAYRWITDELAVSVEAAFECKAGKSDPGWTTNVPPVICSMRRDTPSPWSSPADSALRIRRSSVPCGRSSRSDIGFPLCFYRRMCSVL